ncbi:MAG: glycosyltransferase family 39 protein [Candidatus Glassbacteria bacterium]|nr:glycosyltransferase family 39 protein [Candidatus Glassbacteria bacterium]
MLDWLSNKLQGPKLCAFVNWSRRHPRTVLFAAVFLVYIPSWLVMPGDITVMGGGDSVDYIRLAHSLLEGKGYPSFYRAPLYPFLLTVPVRLAGDSLFIFRMLNAFFHALTLLMLFSLTGKLASRRAAWIFAAFFLVYPHLVYQAANILTESLFMFLVAGTVSLLYSRKPGNRVVFWAGVLSGLAMLTRPNFIVFLPLAAFYLWHSGNFRLPGIKRAAIYLAFTALTISPWTAYNYIRSGGALIPVTTGGGYNFWLGNSIFTMDSFFIDRGRELGGYFGVNPAETAQMTQKDRIRPETFHSPFMNIGQAEKLFYRQSFRLFGDHPLLFARLYAVKFLNALRPWSDPRSRYDENTAKVLLTAVFCLPLLILGLAGMAALWRKNPPGAGLLSIPVVSGFLFLVLFWPSQRFRIPLMDPYLMIFFSYALDRLIDRLRHPAPPEKTRPLLES